MHGVAFLLFAAGPFLADPPADNFLDPARTPAWRNWVRGLHNGSIDYHLSGYGGPNVGFRFSEIGSGGPYQHEVFADLRALPTPEAVALTEALLAMLHDRDRFAAGHLALWKLYRHGDPRPLGGMRLLDGLEIDADVARFWPLHPPPANGEPVLFPRPHAQMARLRRWWAEYFRGERRAFFVAGEDRPRLSVGTFPTNAAEGRAFERLNETYARFLPPRPPNFEAMTVRELEAYYGAPPDVPADFDPDAAPPGFRPPPVPDWRRRAGLPPAD